MRSYFSSLVALFLIAASLHAQCATSTWQFSAGAPNARVYPASAYDATRDVLVVFGGVDSATGALLNDIWEYSNGNWTQPPVCGPFPPARYAAAMAYDPAFGGVVLFGGATATNSTTYPDPCQNPTQTYFDDTWVFDGSTWTPILTMSTRPPKRHIHAMAADPTTSGRIILFGGFGTPVSGSDRRLDDTWAVTPTAWTCLSPSTNPCARAYHAMATDRSRSEIVLFGGDDSNGAFNDTWTFNGTTWTHESPSGSIPTGRIGHRMAYDTDRRTTVMAFGFQFIGSGTSILSDTWEWNGADWTQRASSGPGRAHFSMAYSDASKCVISTNGTTQECLVGAASDTWSWTVPLSLSCFRSSSTVTLTIQSGLPNGIVFLGATTLPGSFPNGWFFGIDISLVDLGVALTSSHFWLPLDGCGTNVAMAIIPPSIPLYMVAIGLAGGAITTPGMHISMPVGC